MKEQIKRIDRAIYQGERAFVVAALAVMSIVVFLDVVHRTFGSEENKAVAATVKLLSYLGTKIEVGSSSYQSLESVLPFLLWPAAVGLAYLAVRTANIKEAVPRGRALAYAAAGVAAAYGLVLLFLKVMPNGVIWSQPLALVLTLWVGFIAASMCTYENKHLKVEAVARVLPAKFKPFVAFASALFTTFVCVCLFWLSMRYVNFNYVEYVDTQGQGGIFKGIDVPKYQCFLALPFSFAVMSVRFMMRGILALGGELPTEVAIEGLDELEKHQKAAAELGEKADSADAADVPKKKAAPPSEVPTEAVRLEESRESGSGEAPLPPSKVVTEPREAAQALDDEASDEEGGEA